jgi:hypothetical protein
MSQINLRIRLYIANSQKSRHHLLSSIKPKLEIYYFSVKQAEESYHFGDHDQGHTQTH